MKLNTRQMGIAAVLAFGLAALAADRLLLGGGAGSVAGPATADAAALDPEEAVGAPRPAAPAPVAGRATDGPAVAERLARVARRRGVSADRVDDAFRPPTTWFALAPTEDAGSEPEPTGPDRGAFLEDHVLSAVLASGQRGVAIVDGRPVRVGEEVDGFHLVAVDRRSARFEAEGQTAVLTLDPAARP